MEKERNQYLYTALDNISDGISFEDTAGHVLYCNKALCNIYSISVKGALKQSHIDPSYSNLVLKTKKIVSYKNSVSKHLNTIVTVTPIYDEKKRITHLLSQHRDLKALKFYNPDIFGVGNEAIAGSTPDSLLSNNLVEFTSEKMQSIYNLLDNMAPKDVNILILGPSGTGKSALAKRIHDNSPRKNGPFVTINCSTIPANLIESELFGYLKGAFTGAINSGKRGLVDTADGGTLFLDEIGELPLELQPKLLQLTQEKTYMPIGGVRLHKVDVRIIAATNQDIPSLIAAKQFRSDLFYRLAVVTVTIPPLKDRPEDISHLIKYFTNVFNLRYETDTSFSKEAIQILCNYSWPGNIREIENLIEFLILNNNNKHISPYMLPPSILQALDISLDAQTNIFSNEYTAKNISFEDVSSLDEFLQNQESLIITELYKKYNTSYKLADRLKISQSKANRLIRKYVLFDDK